MSNKMKQLVQCHLQARAAPQLKTAKLNMDTPFESTDSSKRAERKLQEP